MSAEKPSDLLEDTEQEQRLRHSPTHGVRTHADVRFWHLIATTVHSSADGSIEASALMQALLGLPASEILLFAERCHGLFAESRTWALWGAAALIHDGAPDDTFDYFRSWLIGRGRETYARAVQAPDSLADVATYEALDDVVYGAAETAYRALTGEVLPLALMEWPDLGERFDLTDDLALQGRYPRLYVRFRDDGPPDP